MPCSVLNMIKDVNQSAISQYEDKKALNQKLIDLFEELQLKIKENENKDSPKEGLFVGIDMKGYHIPEIERLPTLSSEAEEEYISSDQGYGEDEGSVEITD